MAEYNALNVTTPGLIQNSGTGFTTTAAGTSGNVATSDGSKFVSSPPAASSLVTTYTSGSGNWTANAKTTYVRVFAWGGGGGGGSGRYGTTAASGGGAGGGGGNLVVFEGPVSAFTGSIPYSVGAAANGGAAVTSVNNGNPGTVGNNTTFGSIIALGGNFGAGGISGTASAGAARNIAGSFFNNAPSAGGGGSGTLNNGSNSNSTGGNAVAYFQPTGGAGGGGANLVTEKTGGTGGGLVDSTGSFLVAPATAGTESGTIRGGDGNSFYANGGILSGGLGGGGGGGQKAGTIGGDGGDGSQPGGGGGGGGGAESTVGTTSGKGGNGAPGKIIVIEYF